jgi:anti-sigma regulatory factor (Ser/Thr protein kinase)
MDKDNQLFSENRLETILHSVNGLNSKAVIEKVVKEVQRFSTGVAQSDDITLLVLGYMGPNGFNQRTISVLLKNDLSELQRLNQIVAEFAEHHGLASELVLRLILVLEEIITNVISYGYDDGLEHEISVRLSWKNPTIKVEVEDDGRPFNPLEAPPPDTGKPLTEMQVGGLGIHLVRAKMDELEYRRENDRNLLILKTKIRET